MAVDNELFRNGSYYADITAYKAMNNIIKERRKMGFNRGEIYEYETKNNNWTKCIIVSADFRSGEVFLNGIILEDKERGENSVPVVCISRMFADCCKVSLCHVSKFGNYIKTASEEEMNKINECIAKCLGIEAKVIEKEVEVIKEVETPSSNSVQNIDEDYDDYFEEYTEAKAEAKVYKELYEKLLAKVIG